MIKLPYKFIGKEAVKNILIVFLLSIAILCGLKYILTLKQAYDLSLALNQAKEQAVSLEKEKQNTLKSLEKEKSLREELSQQNSDLKGVLKASQARLTRFFQQVREKQGSIDQLSYEIVQAKAENASLKEQGDKLKLEIAKVSQEIENLKGKLAVAAEPKLEKPEKQVAEAKADLKPKPKENNNAAKNNRGFLTKNGSVAFSTSPRIEVVPLMNAAPVTNAVSSNKTSDGGIPQP